MAARHRIGAVAIAVLGGGLLVPVVWPSGAAGAHGALENPLSRAAACGAESPRKAGTAACRAAVAVSGAIMREEWDNLRVAHVAGRDRQAIPDGRLCSGGVDAFRGLDLARADWPATTLTSGAAFTFRYRGTIPHRGTFRMYVTTGDYDPSRRLKWSNLERRPFLTVTDPVLKDGSYVMQGRLPADRTGRHLIYTVWQNSDTPDTYYSCSDVIFRDRSRDGGAAPAAARPESTAGSPSTGSPAGTSRVLPWVVGAAAVVATATAAGIASARTRPTGRRHRR